MRFRLWCHLGGCGVACGGLLGGLMLLDANPVFVAPDILHQLSIALEGDHLGYYVVQKGPIVTDQEQRSIVLSE